MKQNKNEIDFVELYVKLYHSFFVSYIDSNEYVSKELELERRKSEKIILTCEQQIKNLDSL